jgi:hypothetical protein
MTGTRTASVTVDCARCVPNAPLLVGVIYCEAKIALSNSLAALGVFSLAYNRGKHGHPRGAWWCGLPSDPLHAQTA